MRRGTSYGFAEKIGASKIALGHHRDDIVGMLFLNMFYQGKLKAMPPKLLSDDGANMVIRPLAYCREAYLQALAELRQYPIISCNRCGSQDGFQRRVVKAMLRDWEREHPGRVETIFSAIKHVAPSQLAETALFDFAALQLDRYALAPVDEVASSIPAINL